MSKLARERKKHWRVIKATAKEQGIELLEPKVPRRTKYDWRQQTVPIKFGAPAPSSKFLNYLKTMFNASMFKPNASQIKFYDLDDPDELKGRSINQVWFDEETIDGGQIIQEEIIYDKDKSN